MPRKTEKQKKQDFEAGIRRLMERIKSGGVSAQVSSILKKIGEKEFTFIVAGFIRGVELESAMAQAKTEGKSPPLTGFWGVIYKEIFGD